MKNEVHWMKFKKKVSPSSLSKNFNTASWCWRYLNALCEPVSEACVHTRQNLISFGNRMMSQARWQSIKGRLNITPSTLLSSGSLYVCVSMWSSSLHVCLFCEVSKQRLLVWVEKMCHSLNRRGDWAIPPLPSHFLIYHHLPVLREEAFSVLPM